MYQRKNKERTYLMDDLGKIAYIHNFFMPNKPTFLKKLFFPFFSTQVSNSKLLLSRKKELLSSDEGIIIHEYAGREYVYVTAGKLITHIIKYHSTKKKLPYFLGKTLNDMQINITSSLLQKIIDERNKKTKTLSKVTTQTVYKKIISDFLKIFPDKKNLKTILLKLMPENKTLTLKEQHGDLSPSNIVMVGKSIHIIDWDTKDFTTIPYFDLLYFSATARINKGKTTNIQKLFSLAEEIQPTSIYEKIIFILLILQRMVIFDGIRAKDWYGFWFEVLDNLIKEAR